MTLVDAPVFLVGSERSGTTLLRLMLDHHPKIAFNFESDYIATQISDEGAYPEMKQYREWLTQDRAFQGSRFSIDERLDFVGLVNHFLIQKQARDGKELVGATIHHQFHKLSRIWPRAKYIYLLRDGRDVAVSAMRMGWAGNTYIAADVWLKAEKERDDARLHVGDERWLEVRYEDLIVSTRPQLERICDFLGVEYSERMFDYVNTSTYDAPDPSLCYQWRTNLAKVEVQRLEEKLGDRLLSRGYPLSGYPRIMIPRLVKKYLFLQSRIEAYRYRLRLYGVGLTLRETLSRRLGLERLHRKTIAKINRVTDAHMK